MSKLRKPIVQMRRDAWVEVNLGSIEHNIKALKKRTRPKTKFMAVVKADAYGHGSDMSAATLVASGVDMLGVASVDEGIQLRDAGIIVPILVLGATPDWAFVSAAENNIQLSIFDEEHINSCIHTYNRLGRQQEVHVKVDTGMHRIGINHEIAHDFINKVLNTPEIALKGVFSHLACAEDREITACQAERWESVINQIPDRQNLMLHLANTAGIISYSGLHYDMVRAGIGIYGLMPDLPLETSVIPEFRQAMSLKGRITHVKEISEGCGVSYGYSYKADKNRVRIATIPIGYADGVPRSLSNRIYGIIKGQKVRQVGNITMDQMMFDVTGLENVNHGDIVTLLGDDNGTFIGIDEWANLLDTINYEVTCRLRVRLPRVYTRK